MTTTDFLMPGYHYDIPMVRYVGDPCEQPSLSTKVAQHLFYGSPHRAYTFHPRLGRRSDGPDTRSDGGSAIHSSLHGGGQIDYCPAVEYRSGPRKGETFIPENWQTKDAQEFQEMARAAGKIPLLEHQRRDIEAATAAGREALAEYGVARHEVTMVWRFENGVYGRGRADALTDSDFDIDTKSVLTLDADKWYRNALASRLDMQMGLRSLGHKALGRPRRMLWMLLEIEPPYEVAFIELEPDTLAKAEAKCLRAAELWGACLASGNFPKLSRKPQRRGTPVWAELEFEERMAVSS